MPISEIIHCQNFTPPSIRHSALAYQRPLNLKEVIIFFNSWAVVNTQGKEKPCTFYRLERCLMCQWEGRKYFEWYRKPGTLSCVSGIIALHSPKKHFLSADYLLDTVLDPGAEQ